MASYRERIERYLESHPGASISEARGHGKTPEHPTGYNAEKYQEYHERRSEAEAHTNWLKEQKFGQDLSYNADSAANSTSRIPIAQLEDALAYDDLDDYIEDVDYEVDDNFGYYH